MKKYITAVVLGLLVAFTPYYYAQAATITQAQYISVLEQLLNVLEQELAALQSQTPMEDTQNIQSTGVDNTTPVVPLQVYKLVYEPEAYNGSEDLYLWGNIQADPTTVQVKSSDGTVLPITFTGEGIATQNCVNIQPTDTDTNVQTDGTNPVKVCGGFIQRMQPSESFSGYVTKGEETDFTVSFTTADGQSYTQKVPVTI